MSARSENIHITCKLTPAEIEAIDAEAGARGVSLSQVVDEAVSALLRDSGIYQTGLPLPPRAAGAPAIQRGYRLPPATVGLMDTAKREYGFEYSDVIRAAVAPLVRRRRP
jgi:hypothetical protein